MGSIGLIGIKIYPQNCAVHFLSVTAVSLAAVERWAVGREASGNSF